MSVRWRREGEMVILWVLWERGVFRFIGKF